MKSARILVLIALAGVLGFVMALVAIMALVFAFAGRGGG
jgi:hypothetical protein